MKYVVIWTLVFHDKWNALDRQRRKELQDEMLPQIIEKYQGKINIRTVDTEGFSAKFQDFVIIETDCLSEYYCMLQDMRNTKILSEGYLKISNIFMGIENAHEIYQKNFT
ncbi:darcynin family protein [Vibrio proteolyticus]